MKNYTQEEIKKILDDHKKWLDDKSGSFYEVCDYSEFNEDFTNAYEVD